MPRDSNGVYSLPVGNPVVTGTTISSTWANTTLEDIGDAITDSLSRSGDGGMTAPLALSDGAVGAPGLTWSSETTSGLYRAGAGDHRYSLSGTDKLQITTNGLRAADGAVGTPAFSFISDTDIGMYRNAANVLGLVAGGANIILARSDLANTTAQFPSGSAAVPGISFQSDPDTGIFNRSGNEVTVTAAGATVAYFNASFVQFDQIVNIPNGAVGTPALTFSFDPDTGIYRTAANQIGFSTGGTLQGLVRAGSWDFNPGGGAVNFQVQATGVYGVSGLSSAPSYSFISGADTGMYLRSAGQVGVACSGADAIVIDSTGLSVLGRVFVLDGSVGSPAISFGADTDTGMYRIGTNILGFSCGNSLYLEMGSPGSSNYVELGFNSSTDLGFNCLTAGSATAGAATLPSNPASFIVLRINGSQVKVPYYNA